MGNQKGIYKIEGNIGDINYYKTRDGYKVKEKSGVSASRIANDPHYQGLRDHMAEFSRAIFAGKLIRQAFKPILKNTADSAVAKRLSGALIKVVKSDPLNDRGMRTVQDGSLELLENFNFNSNCPLSSVLEAKIEKAINRTTGEIQATVPKWNARLSLKSPEKATHFKLISAAAEFDFLNQKFIEHVKSSAPMLVNQELVPQVVLVNTLTPQSTLPILQVLGIEFLEMVNGKEYPVLDTGFNSADLIQVDVN